MKITWKVGGLYVPNIGYTTAGEIHLKDLPNDIALDLIGQGIAQEYIEPKAEKTVTDKGGK